jgi:ADP-heptose:LPS heptosyltransferase
MNPAPRLLIRLGSMGDVTLATAAAHALRGKWGDACVDVLVKEEWAPLWRNHPAVNDLLVLSREDRGLLGFRRWILRLKEANYADVVDLQASPRTEFLLLLARLRNVRRPRRHALRRRLLVRLHRGGPPATFRMVDAFVEAAVPGARALPSIVPGPEARARAAQVVPSERRLVGLVPGGRHATKCWPIRRFVELGQKLVGQGLGPVPVFFSPGEESFLASWRARWPGDGTWTPVREDIEIVAACLARLGAVVTNDTGLMHVAAAVGTPVTAIFGPTVRQFGFVPAGEGHRILEVENLSCRPCSVHGGPHCPREHFRCMLDTSVEVVAEAVLAALRGRPTNTGNATG